MVLLQKIALKIEKLKLNNNKKLFGWLNKILVLEKKLS